jgi:hypothetical protein
MKNTSGRSAAGRLGTVPAAAALVVLSSLLAACSGGYEKLSSQPYDTDYDVFSVLSMRGNLDVFLIKAFESDGKVALCGGYTRGTSSFSTIGNRQWADISHVYIGDTKIGTAEFMAQMPVYGFKDGEDPKAMFIALQEENPSLPCVRSKVAWKAGYENAKIERRGPNRLRVFD